MRFVVDCGAVLRIVSMEIQVAAEHVTLDAKLARRLDGVVATAKTDALTRA